MRTKPPQRDSFCNWPMLGLVTHSRTVRNQSIAFSAAAHARSRHPPDPKNLVKFPWREWPVTGRNGTEHFCVELDFVKGHAVVDPKIETLTHRAHLHRRADSRNLRQQGYDAARRPRMTQQGHSWTSFG